MNKLLTTVALALLSTSAVALDFQPQPIVEEEELEVVATSCETVRTEYQRVEVPIYLPSEENSLAVADLSALKIYLYNTQKWVGPKDTGDNFQYLVLEWREGMMFELVEVEE